MLATQVCVRASNAQFSKVNLSKKILGSTWLSTRHQTNAAAAQIEQKDDLSSEWANARPFHQIPQHSTLKMIRNFMPGGKYHKKDINAFVSLLRQELGDICYLPGIFGRAPIIFTHNVDDFEQVYRNEGIWPQRPGAEALAYYRSKYRADFFQDVEGISSTQGEKWGKFRSAVNPVLMQPKNARLYLNRMGRVNLELVERIKESRDPETLEVPATFEEDINRWTLESVSVFALDRQLGMLKENRDNPEAKRLSAALAEFFHLGFQLEFGASAWRYVITPDFRRLMKAFDEILDVTSKYVNEAIERLEKENIADVEKPESEKSVLEKLLRMDKKIATVMAMDLLMAGVDTTSSTFAGALLCLAKNPHKQAKLREEIYSLLPSKDSDFNEETFKNAPYLRACIKESLRVYPLTMGNLRVPQRDVVLSGYQVPKGIQVFMVTAEMQQDEKQFPRASEFLPERWLRASKDAEGGNALKASSPFSYLPFGFGPRSCIGKRIVELELEAGLARIVRNFNVEFNHPCDKPFKSLLINVPNIPLKFKFSDVA